MLCANVRFWHLASFAATHHFVRFWTTADKVGFWPGTVYPQMTQSGHWPNSFTDEFMRSRLNRLWLPLLRFSETGGETRTRLIKVVSKNEIEVGVPHWNSTRHPINV
jgi:hypothetical protein